MNEAAVPKKRRIHLISCLGVGLDLWMLPHFLAHYTTIGIEPGNIHVILHDEVSDTENLTHAERILHEMGAVPPRRWIGPYTSDAMWSQRRSLQRDVGGPHDWIVNSDIDEHYAFPAPLSEIVAHCDEIDVNCVQGLQIDRFASGGVLAPVRDSPTLSEQFPIEGEASYHVFGTGRHHGISATTKLMLHRADILPRRGGHNPEGVVSDAAESGDSGAVAFLAGRPLHQIKKIADPAYRFTFPFQSAHFKWTAGRLPSVHKRLDTPGVSPAGEEYGGKVVDYLTRHGCVRLNDVALRQPGQVPPADWKAKMRALRDGPRKPAAPRAPGCDVFVVIRAAGERTEAVAHELARRQVGAERVAVLREVPFASAVRKAFERGVAAGAEWTLCLDADVLLRPGAIDDLVTDARSRTKTAFGVSGRVADPLLGQWRVAGQHLYRTAMLVDALKICDFDPDQRRPESHVKRQMKAAGHGWTESPMVMGLHDDEQSFADIFRKVVVHSRKHARFMGYARDYWARAGADAPDLRIALHALDTPERIAPVRGSPGEGAHNVVIDRRDFPLEIDAFLNEIGLSERPPLAAGALGPTDIAQRLEAFEEAPEWLRDRGSIEAAEAARLDAVRRASATAGAAGAEVDARLVSCVGVDRAGGASGDLALLPHFLDHYRSLGILPERMHLILNARDADSSALAQAMSLLERAGTVLPEIWIGDYTSGEMWQRRCDLQRRIATPDDWIVNADVDEFHSYPCSLRELAKHCSAEGIRCVQGPLIDRIAADGRLNAIAPDPPLSVQFPVAADVGIAIGKRAGAADATGTVKLMFHRGDVLPTLGGHHPQGTADAQQIYGMALTQFPRIKNSIWRARLPFRAWHYKWTAGLGASLEERRATPGASPAGSRYGGQILNYLERRGGRIDIGDIRVIDGADHDAGADWRHRVAEITDAAAGLRPLRARADRIRATHRNAQAALGVGWTLRQLTFGSGAGAYHAHSYYDIPVLSEDASRIAAYRMSFEGRWMTAEDTVEIGIVDVERGGFRTVGVSQAWSWQQGPMAQWLPGGRHMVWNDRDRVTRSSTEDGDAFVARLHDTETGVTRTLDRPVYALSPEGDTALSVNMARLDRARPGYGYTGGRGAGLNVGAPDDDGIWRMDLTRDDGAPRLILPLSRAVSFLARRLPEGERKAHLSGAFVHWFNHVKVSPNGRRFTAKLRWRDADLKGRWTGLMGVSVTCNIDGTDLALLARGTSHVMWLDDETLYFWHQAEQCFATIRDSVPEGVDRRVPHPETITANVHFRHVPDDPNRAIYDTPYAEEIDVMQIDRSSGRTVRLARFAGHVPHHGPFRCDLHPVPSRDGRRIVVTSLQDGGRQLYVLERRQDP